MNYRQLGNTGLMVSEVGFGGEWLERHEEAESVALIHYAGKQGINIIVNLAPAIAVVLSAIPLLWYDINGKAKMDEIYAALEARNAAQKKEQ